MNLKNYLAIKNHSSSGTLAPGGNYVDDIPLFNRDLLKLIFSKNDAELNTSLINDIDISAKRVNQEINQELMSTFNPEQKYQHIKVGFKQINQAPVNVIQGKYYGVMISLQQKEIGEFNFNSVTFNPSFTGTGIIKLINLNNFQELHSENISCVSGIGQEINIQGRFNASLLNDKLLLVFIPNGNYSQMNYSLLKKPVDAYCTPCVENAKTSGFVEVKAVKLDSISGNQLNNLQQIVDTTGFQLSISVYTSLEGVVGQFPHLFSETLFLKTGIKILSDYLNAPYWLEKSNPMKEEYLSQIKKMELEYSIKINQQIKLLKNIYPYATYSESNQSYSIQIP